jgi:anti-sigma factor RsiW
MMKKEHLTPDRMRALKDGLLSGDETIGALEHIGECELCASAFADSYSEAELLELSPAFRSAVLSAIERENRTAISAKKKAMKAGGRRELFRYSFRVSVAACITLFLLFSGTISYGMDFSRSIHPDLSGINAIMESVKGFSDKLVNFNVSTYIKEEL